jgi:hypothetical protein
MKIQWLSGLAAAVVLSLGQTAWAGPVIIDGTDSNDHGGTSSGANVDGWLYMQKALENLASQIDASVTKTVVNLGATSGGALDAITSAFTLSSLPGAGGWTLSTVDGPVLIDAWLSGLSTANTGILYIPTADLTGGDLEDDEAAVINTHGTDINAFVAGPGDPLLGGGLFAMAQSPDGGVTPYGWLTSLLPGITITELGSGSGLTLTADGTAAFPGLTSADLSTGPWHNYFEGDFGGLKVLATAPQSDETRNVILGGGAGTVIVPEEPGVIPEPGTIALFMLGMTGFGMVRRRSA